MSSFRTCFSGSQDGWKLCFSSFIDVATSKNSPQALTCVYISKLIFLGICVHYPTYISGGYFNLSLGVDVSIRQLSNTKSTTSIVDYLHLDCSRATASAEPVSSTAPCLPDPEDSQLFIPDFLQHLAALLTPLVLVCHCLGIHVTSWLSFFLFSTSLTFPSSSAHC